MRRIKIIHLGIGKVGKEVVRQIFQQKEYIQKNYNLDIQYCGLFNSKGGVFNRDGLTFEEMRDFPFRLNSTIESVVKKSDESSILIDTTASDKTGELIAKNFRNGGYAVISNKKPLSDSQYKYDELQNLGKNRFLYETTVGAGLPIINTLKSMIATGDEIESIEGCFSGTLGFIFSSLEDGVSFSQAIIQAKAQGFTEPDPRDDLKGLDVARKALILARLMGIKLEL